MTTGTGRETGGGLIGWLDRHHSGVTALAALSVPVITAGAGYWVASNSSDRQTQAQYVNVASSILSEELAEGKVPEEQRALREYAVKLLAHSSPVAIEDGVQQALIDGTITLDTSAFIGNLAEMESQGLSPDWLERAAQRVAAAEATEIAAPDGCTVTIAGLIGRYGQLGSIDEGTYEVEAIRTLTGVNQDDVDIYQLEGVDGWVLSSGEAFSASGSCP